MFLLEFEVGWGGGVKRLVNVWLRCCWLWVCCMFSVRLVWGVM